MLEVEAGTVLLIGTLDADPDLWRSETLAAVLSVYYHCYGKPTPDIPACLGVEFPPLGG